MKKLIYLIVLIVAFGLIVSGCLPVVPPTEQSEPTSLTRGNSIYYVSTTGNDTYGNGTETWVDNTPSGWGPEDTGPWLTISHALTQVSAGETIIVAPGTYVEYTGAPGAGCAVTIPWFADGAGGLTIESSGGAVNTIINCGAAAWGVQMVSNQITFTGFTVKNAYSVINQVSGKGHTLSNLIITDFVNYGLGVYHGVDCQFSDITIHTNDVNKSNNRLVKGIDMQGYGSGGNSGNSFEDITVYDIETTGTYGTSIGIWWSTSSTFPDWDNTFTDVTIHDLTAENWMACGIKIKGSAPGTTPYAIENTLFSGGSIYNIGSDAAATRGFYVDGGCKGLSIRGFDISGGDKGIYFSHHGQEACKNVDIHDNNIVGNTEYGVQDYDGDNDVDATCNWWGDNSGPSGEGPGTGDAVSLNVDYNPWLTQGSSLVYTGVPQPENLVVLEATLSDSTGISGMDVEFYLEGIPVGNATTDSDGVARFDIIGPVSVGVYEVYASVCNLQSETGYLAVYDPSEGLGFVTGGGWIDSPAGASTQYPTAAGKASFGFVSKYQKGQSTPTGNTEFQFKAGDLNFHSDSYDWLVVAGAKAKYKGTGTINGTGNYGFMLFAIDEKLTPSTDVDMFRIKIWDKDDGDALVYDNNIGEDDDADPTTEIAGGQIVIHKGK